MSYKVRDLIADLQKLDPELPCINIVGDCDEVYEANGPVLGYIDDEENPMSWSLTQTRSAKVKAVQV